MKLPSTCILYPCVAKQSKKEAMIKKQHGDVLQLLETQVK